MTDNTEGSKLEIHYHFVAEDNSHTMDAIVRNRCEYEILQIANNISKELGLDVKVETEIPKEGGHSDLYTFIFSKEGTIILTYVGGFLTALIPIILSRIPSAKSKLEKEDLRLSIEERKLNIAQMKLQRQLEDEKINLRLFNIENINHIVNENVKIIKHKSNFYRQLKKYVKVDQISATQLNASGEAIEKPYYVERKDFEKFIFESDELEDEIDEQASIEIISPVLKKGNFKWKGFYNQNPQPIDFAMKDNTFKNEVIEKGVEFKSGVFIDCILVKTRKIDDLGNIYISSYTVTAVMGKHENGVAVETASGKKHRKKLEADKEKKKQLGLFNDEATTGDIKNA